jgi:formyltetrahydrofolate deformylase
MVTKESHCMGDLLLRHFSDELNINILSIISNYNNLSELASKFNIPYKYIAVDSLNREEHEILVTNELNKFNNIDFIVLAKYMRVLTPNFVSNFEGKLINIHHSFLPAFIGANPYKRAHDRGVKIIGATSHYVTSDLDEGPIITQEILHVNHTYSATDLKVAGRNVEKIALSKALDLAIEEKIFIFNNKTIIL